MTECRLCGGGAAADGAPAVGLFDKTKKGVVQVVGVVKECLPNLLIYRTDPLSKHICEPCHTKINEMYDFKMKVMEVFQQHKQELLQKTDDTKAQLYLEVLNNQKNEEPVPTSPDTKNQYSSTDDIPPPQFLTVKKFKEASKPLDVLLNGFLNDDTNTTNTESDMELCDPLETNSKIIVTRKRRASQLNGPIPKKKRMIGPKSRMQPNPRIKIVKRAVYNPLSLLGCCVDYFNGVNGLEKKGCEIKMVEDEEIVNLCMHCGVVFDGESELASHELSEHIRLSLEKVDAFEYWDSREKYAAIRNKWFKKSLDIDDSTETDEEDEEDDDYEDRDYMGEGEEEEGDELLVRMDQQMKAPPLNIARNDNIVFVNEHPTINGIALRDIPRDKRHDFYQSVKLNGARRKFCTMCRYTFKDNWAIDLHYQTRMCYYTCHYCGHKFTKNKVNFTSHVEEHIANGDQKSLAVFVSRSKFSTVPKVLSADCLKPYVPGPPRVKGVIKGMINFSMQDGVRVKEEKIEYEDEDEEYDQPPSNHNKVMTTADLARTGNKAYFCKKCYQVFTNLQEFNIHVTTCNGEIDDPELHRIRPYHRKERKEIKEEYVKPPPKPKQEPPQELYSPTGRPVRTCVREVSYNDDKDFEYTMRRSHPNVSPSVTMTPTQPNNTPTAAGRYECMMCSSVFPTVHSRNSHMRIHKSGYKPGGNKPATIQRNPQQQRSQPTYIKQEPMDEQTFPAKRIKQETFEPIVEIHEGHSSNNRVPTNIGSVSITPVRKTNGKPMTMSPAIMQLVQNNPNITIKAKNGESPKQFIQQQPQQKREELEYPSPSSESENKIYKCSSCSKPFNNKSNLYFHKKNHCNGSKYPCPFCKKRFGTEASYSSHIFYSHPV